MTFVVLLCVALAQAFLSISYWLVLIYVVLGWLFMLRIVNPYQPIVQAMARVLTRLIEPVLRHIRRFVSPWNGVDLSPVVLLIMIWVAQNLLSWGAQALNSVTVGL